MTPDLTGPADTSMMRIVHTALRRDIDRAQTVLTDRPYPDGAQRTALSAHLLWMMKFLRHRHETEDEHLYPIVRAANPGAAALLDDIDAEHAGVQPAIATVDKAAASHGRARTPGKNRFRRSTRLATCSSLICAAKEDEMMPVVSATITERQWRDWDQANNVKPLSTP